jgi:tRNA (cmo5U34)-methyltransferase
MRLEMSTVGDGLKAENADWKFDSKVAENFEMHAIKSIPNYAEGHHLITSLSDFFVTSKSLCYEVGCSTGRLTHKLAKHNLGKAGSRFIGIDIETEMIQAARNKIDPLPENVEFIEDDILQIELEPADLIISYYTVQFIRPAERQRLITKLYDSLQWGGALVMFEKVRGPDARFQDILTRLYDDYKLEKGYSAEEIISKSRSLKGVLEPFSTQGNIDLLKRAGFVDIMTVMKQLSFEGFLAIK